MSKILKEQEVLDHVAKKEGQATKSAHKVAADALKAHKAVYIGTLGEDKVAAKAVNAFHKSQLDALKTATTPAA